MRCDVGNAVDCQVLNQQLNTFHDIAVAQGVELEALDSQSNDVGPTLFFLGECFAHFLPFFFKCCKGLVQLGPFIECRVHGINL